MDWQSFINRCCSLDLETNENGDIFAIAAQFSNQTFQRRAPFDIHQTLRELDAFAADADFLLGHNLLLHDLPVCRALKPDLACLNKMVVDTLFLSPLAFPENPYHRLVKNYRLVRDGLSDPLLDAKLAESLFQDQWIALQDQQQHCDILSFYHYAFSGDAQYSGLQQTFIDLGAGAINASRAFDLFKQLSRDQVCETAFNKVILTYLPDPHKRPALAYSLAWLRVAGGNSVLPPWVRQTFQDVAPALSQLRDIPCGKPACNYCRQIHDPVTQLTRYFGFPAFRNEPPASDGGSLQQQIVQAAMADTPLFAVLPTGGGKSLCFQLPALVRYQRRGVLTIVISPLQALMKDQVDNLRNKTGAPSAAALYGMLTPPERGEVLKAIQMGDIAILYVSPEQLRNAGFRKAIAQREIGCWVFDEAHCLSKWGHDFRPDYLYAARFIQEFAAKQNAMLPPVQCFTATAKQDVRDEIIDYFRAHLAQELALFEGGVERNNLQFEVQTVGGNEKYARIQQLLDERLTNSEGSAIVYCSTKKHTEEVAEFLQHQNWSAAAFHAGKDAAEKRHVQESFVDGSIRVIAATNAFGMGIDKENVRLVIHADIPGSLENYLQEAGRAGRDREAAECVLLFDEHDIETQFKLSALSQVDQRDIAQILRGLRRSKKDRDGNVVITSGEILQDDNVQTSFDSDDRNAATKIITAVSWLERAGFIERNENRTQVFQGRPLVKNLEQAKAKIAKLDLSERQQKRWLAILEELFNADSDEGFSADDLALLGEFATTEQDKLGETASQRVIRTLYDMTSQGLIQQNLLLTAFVRYKIADSSLIRLEKICPLELAMIEAMREQAPDAADDAWQTLSLRHINQHLLDNGYSLSNPEVLRLLLNSLARDGLGLAGNKGSLTLRHRGLDQYAVKLNRGWKALIGTAEKRQAIAKIALDRILANIPPDTKAGADLLVEFSAEQLMAELRQDLVAAAEVKDHLAAVERALNFLHEQKVITLQQGLAVFRQAMTIRVLPEAKSRRYGKGDYQPLSQHYGERVFQIHVMNEYARRGLEKIGQALAFVVAYFAMDKTEFVKRYFADRREVLERATSQQSFQRIVSDLQNPEQIALVAGPEDKNMLILAGPGSGKTRVVVHRCAYLLRVKRVPARSILVLCFNRNAATELRRRLSDLAGDDSKGVTIQTYHGLALRLTGHTLNNNGEPIELAFSGIIEEAIKLLQGDQSLLGLEADESRDRLLAGYRHILVDEYQDINDQQYRLVSAIAGRTSDDDAKLTILAVGDDDQNIYEFNGTNVGFIKKFQSDYQADLHFLLENYRSSAHIIAAANALIAHNHGRMKQQQPIRINRQRKNLEAGGRWRHLDTLARGRVQQIQVANEASQAMTLVLELRRMRQLDTRLDWSQCAVLAREWRLLDPVRAELERHDIPLSILLPGELKLNPFRIRENADVLQALKQAGNSLNSASFWLDYLADQYPASLENTWIKQLQTVLLDWQRETADSEVSNRQTLDYVCEILAEQRRERRLGSGVLLSTMHAVKGMEFSHVLIADGGWTKQNLEEQRRLFYVAMTRAKETLCLIQRLDQQNPFLKEIQGEQLLIRPAPELAAQENAGNRIYQILGLQDVDLSYAGSFASPIPIHQQLATLMPGSVLGMVDQQGQLSLQTNGITVARLSRAAHAVWRDRLHSIERITVIAMLKRFREDGSAEYHSRCKVNEWLVPVVEVVYQDTPSILASSKA
ncbi:RecQ family ATP-dependent DNA helicase [Methylomonas sp. LL1]|uniref:RecQ family ATP-dependent DNA helicase n=1 Tax=Methylomonas sp. LL1 TaxID=2785785 RepID=UPI0018C43A17|nr:RecQ family ATP-dependent DNA helicase [Methylomonas sp. LL1]QPK64965.1 RecQ family ATP-dependent DNA helicase [Methylomonas sp. LL1]